MALRNVFDFVEDLVNDADVEEEIEGEESEEEDNIIEEISDDEEEELIDEPVDPGDNLVSKDGNIIYLRNRPQRRGRAAAAQVVRNLEATIPGRINCDTILSSFLLFYTNDIHTHIVRETNREAHRVINLPESPAYLRERWYDITEVEMFAFIGLLLEAGVMRDCGRLFTELYDERRGNHLFKATMSCFRFQMILRFLRFDNKATRPERRQMDKLAAFREVWNLFVENFRRNYNPSSEVTVDEQMVPFKGRAPFKMYMKDKPHKFGFKIWLLCDASTSYCYNAEVYLGRQEGQPREVGQGARVVRELVRPLEGSGRNITTDQFFTSYALAQSLLDVNLTLLGTIKKNRLEVPTAMLPNRRREQFESIFGHAENVMIVSYVPKVNKSVVLLTTTHQGHETQEDGKRLPQVILDYNQSKCGVDNCNKMVLTYTVRRKINRWPATLFFNSIDLAALNALIVWLKLNPMWKQNQKNMRRRIFLRDLADSLVLGHIQSRGIERPHAIRRNVQEAINRYHGLPQNAAPAPVDQVAGIRRKCHLCNDNRRVRTLCTECRHHVCPNHSRILCHNC